MSLDFLSATPVREPDGRTPEARSPMQREMLAAGAVMEVRAGWRVAARYGPSEREVEALRDSVVWLDSSHLAKLEVQADPVDLAQLVAGVSGVNLEPRRASRGGAAWWCQVTAGKAIALCEPADLRALREQLEAAAELRQASVVDVTAAHAALTLAGPLSRETIARFCAIDLRPRVAPVGSFHPGSIARTPGYVLCEDIDRYLMLFGWALAEYMWTTVADAAGRLGGVPAGMDAVPALAGTRAEAMPHA